MDTKNPFIENENTDEVLAADLFAEELEEQVSNAAAGGCISTISTMEVCLCTLCTGDSVVAR